MTKRIAVVTGAARGIGLELCRQLIELGYEVVACPRQTGSEELSRLVRRHPDGLSEIAMDVGSNVSIASAASAIASRVEHIDLLINNAGVYPEERDGLETLDPQDLLLAFRVNSIGPLCVARALLPLLREGREKRLVQITSLMGSIGDNSSGGSYAYRMSKAALNMANRNLAHELGPEGFIVLTMHPGWVRTRMGGAGAPLEVEASVRSMLATVLGAGPQDNGTFKGPDGRSLPY